MRNHLLCPTQAEVCEDATGRVDRVDVGESGFKKGVQIRLSVVCAPLHHLCHLIGSGLGVDV